MVQVGELGLGLLLSTVIGLEREVRQKSAGLRTHSLVGLGAALFMLVSKYGFSDVLAAGQVTVDPSRVAAQIVTGIGFLGAGLIFVRRDSVHGLTTAASVWVTAAIGAAAGAGLPLLAAAATAAYLTVALAFQALSRRLPRSGTAVSLLRVRYLDGHGTLRQVLQVTTACGFAVDELAAASSGADDGQRMVEVLLHVHGTGSVNDLATRLSELPGVRAVTSEDANALVG
ncbi:MAG TPA: MgtC/SapB family protein [Streptosporangiaceae bacterium]|nr:MgtC/SapB family protein [Streptosporangiaceae bacterium]